MTRTAVFSLCLGLLAAAAGAEVRTKSIEYQHDGATYEGTLAWDDEIEGPRPGVLVVHEWWGLEGYARRRASELASLGYVAFALDMYGKGIVTEDPREAGEWSRALTSDVELWRSRARAGLEVLAGQPNVDSRRLGAIGYCFGGSTVLELAYAGEELAGVVSFHGSLPVPSAEDAKRIRCPVLICHGAADRFVTAERIAEFQAALDSAGVDWQLISYAGAVHSFTNPAADRFGIDGVAHHEKAERRSWAHMRVFFEEVFGRE